MSRVNEAITTQHRTAGAFIGVAVGVGSGLGATMSSITGDWRWMPIILSSCIGLAAIAAALTHCLKARP